MKYNRNRTGCNNVYIYWNVLKLWDTRNERIIKITEFDSFMEFSTHAHVARWSVWITDALVAVKGTRRRKYTVTCPNKLWHINGNHKLIRLSLVIHGAIDGYSRWMMCLKCSSNNLASTVLKLFEDVVKEHSMPSRVWGDHSGKCWCTLAQDISGRYWSR